MDEKTLKLLERALQENLTPESVAYIMKYNGYDQSAIDSAVEELKKKRAAEAPQQPSTSEAQMGSGESPSVGNQDQGQDALPSVSRTPVTLPPNLQAYFTQQARGLVPMAGLNDEVITPEERIRRKEEWDRKVAAGEVPEPGGSVILRHFAEEDRRQARELRDVLDAADAQPTVMLPGMVMTPETMERGQAELNQQQNEKRRQANEQLSATLGTQVNAYEDDGSGNMVATEQQQAIREYSVGLASQAEYRINEFIVDEAKRKAQVDPVMFGATGNFLTAIPEVIMKTAGMMMEGAGIIDEEAADFAYEEMRQRRMNRYYSVVNNPEMGVSESIGNGDFENAFQQILFAGSDFVPQIIVSIAAPGAGFGYAGMSASSSTYDEYRNRMDLTPEEKLVLVGGAAAIEVAMEKLGFGDIKAARQFLGIAAEEVGTKAARNKVLTYLKPITKGFIPEFGEEFTVSVANQALAMKIAGEKFSWRDAFDEGLIGGIFGSTTVGVPQVLAAGANGMASRGRMKQFKQITNQIAAIQDALAQPEITDTERAILREELVRLGIEQANLTQTSVKDYEAMNEKDQQDLVGIHSEINEAVELYENAKDKTAKSLALRSVKRALDKKAEIESRYDSKTQTGLRGTQQEGQDARTVPQPGTGTETSPANRVVQTPQTEVDPVFHSPKFEVDGQGRPIAQDPAKSDKEVFTAGGVRETSKLDADNASALNRIFGVTSQIVKDAKVVVHHNLQSLINENGKAIAVYLKKGSTPMAYYIPSKDGKAAEFHVLSQQAYDKYNEATGRQIDANKTYAHEMVHPIISAMLSLDSEVESGLYKQLEMLAQGGNEIAKAAIAFGAKYTKVGQANKVQNEAVTEFFALMADPARFETLDRTFKQKVMKMFNELLARLGFDIKVTTDQDLIMMASNIHSAIKLGAEIALPQSNKSYQKRSLDFSLEEETKPAGSRLFNEPLEGVQDIIQTYVEKAGIDYRPGKNINTIDTERAKRIGEAYDRMEHNPTDPAVKKAYEAMAKETLAQHQAILDAGYEVEINNTEPYANSADMIADLRDNKRMKIFSTESGFGDTPITDQQRAENPLLRDSGFKDVNGQPLLVNDVFRFVHDFFGHAERGNSFGAKGEENAWDAHSRMYSPEARKAMTSETRGQNSWVNFSGVNDDAFKLRDKARALRKQGKTDEAAAIVEQVYEMMRFADQKVGLLPDEFVENDYDEVSFALEDVKGTEKVLSGKVANTVINKAKRTESQSLSVNDIDYGNLSTTAQPVGLSKKILGGTFSYKKQGKTVSLPIGIKNNARVNKIDRLVGKIRTAKGSEKTALKKVLGAEVQAAMMDIKEFMKANIRMLYSSLTPEFVEKSKQWYDGANRIAQQLASDYSVTLEQASGILAALSPQNDWFNNITNANHVMDIMSKERNTQLDDNIIAAAVEYSNSKNTKPGDSDFSQRLKALYAEIGNVSISDLEAKEAVDNADYGIAKANIVRALSLAKMSQENKTIDPEGNVVGTYDMPHTWMTDNVIVNAINIFTDGSPEVISSSLGDGNKVRNFYNNIVDPNSAEEYLTADTHALAVALGSPISAADAGGFGLFGGNESVTYAIVKDAYIEVANEIGLLPRQLQSVTWEAVRTGVNNPARPKKKETLKLIQQLSNTDLPYEDRAIEIIKLNPSFTPEWAVKRGITAQKETSELRPIDQPATDAGDGGVPPSRGEGLGRVRGRDSGMGQDVAGEVDFAIDWYESPEGKGDPAISRRDAQLEEAAQDLLAGRIKNYEFREMAKGLSPIEPITQFFAPASQERMAAALSKDKVKSLNAPVAEGQVVALRLDIPAYTSSNTWVVSLHDGLKRDGKVVSYRNVARITDVVFKSNPLAALNIAAGEAKSTIGRMFGKFKSFDGATVEEQAESAKAIVNEIWRDRSWKQIGMNPTRASYFYDRASGRPVLSAEEVVQIGGLVYAKNPVYTKWNDPAFQVSGYNDVDGSPIYFSLDDSSPDASNLRRTVDRTLGRFSDETRARILANPKAYMTPQSINTIKENLELLSDDELVENMTAEALQMVANTANPGKGENDISVLAAVELLNRKAANGEDVSELLVNLAQLGTTVGRMLRHFAELKSSTPMGIVETVRSVLKKADRLMTPTQETRLTDIAQRFIDAQRKVVDLRDQLVEQFDPALEAELQKATKDLDKVTRELNKFTSLIIPKKTQDLLTTTIQGNLLTPISQVTNVVANLWQIGLSIPVRSFETLGSSLYALFGGKKFRSFPASITALPYALKQAGVGIGEALTTIIKGGSTTEKIVHSGFLPGAAFLAALSDTRFAQAVNAAFGKDVIKGDVLPRLANGKIAASDRAKALYEGMFGVAPEVMFRFLALGDKPFYRFAEAMQLAQEADKLGLKGEARRTFLKYPSKKAAKAADAAGKRLTFQQDSQAASAVFQVMKTLGRIPGVGKALEFMLKVSLPYVKTPANIFTETMAFAIPGFGFARGAQRIWTGKTQDGISDMAKAATGQMIIMAANQLIAQGLIQGAFTDEDDEERALKYLQQPPMTVNIDGLIRLLNGEDPAWQPTDRVRRYDKLGIVGMVMGARVTAVKNNLTKSKDKEEGYYVGEEKSFFEPFTYVWDQLGVPLATFQTLNQQSFLAGSSSLLKVLSGGASERDVEDWFESTFRALTAVPFPNTLSAIHRGMREYMPSIKTKNPLTKFKYVVMDRLFMTDGIPARVDAFGEKIPQTPEGANRWIYNLADPTKAQETTGDPLWAEIYRVYSLNEESKVIPGFPSKLTQLPTKNPLNSKPITGWNAEVEEKWLLEMERLQIMYGKEQREIVNDLVTSDYYNASSNEDKEAMLIEVLDAYQSGRKPTLKAPVPGMVNIKRKQAWLREYEAVVDQFFQ